MAGAGEMKDAGMEDMTEAEAMTEMEESIRKKRGASLERYT
jgi:hypothetical protein